MSTKRIFLFLSLRCRTPYSAVRGVTDTYTLEPGKPQAAVARHKARRSARGLQSSMTLCRAANRVTDTHDSVSCTPTVAFAPRCASTLQAATGIRGRGVSRQAAAARCAHHRTALALSKHQGQPFPAACNLKLHACPSLPHKSSHPVSATRPMSPASPACCHPCRRHPAGVTQPASSSR